MIKDLFPAELLRSFTGYTRGERNGSLLMIGMVILLLAIKISLPYWFSPDLQKMQLRPLLPEIDSVQTVPSVLTAVGHSYDLNQVSEKELRLLFLPDWMCARIIKFRKRHPFQSVTELKNIYGMRDTCYARIEKNLFVSISPLPGKAHVTRRVPEKELLELNSADSSALEALPGIGAYTALKVIRFRDALGGYYSLEQLKELRGTRPETLEALLKSVFIKPASWHKLKINSLNETELAAHPYLDIKQARVIRNYILAHGSLKGEADLHLIGILNDQDVKKLAPYLDWD